MAALLFVSCASGAGSGSTASPAARALVFTDIATTQLSGRSGGAAIVVATDDATRAQIGQVRGVAVPTSVVGVGAFQGEQATGGYAIRITGVERSQDRLVVRATFTAPPQGAIVTQVITSPAHVVGITSTDAAGLREAVLLDEKGTERARTRVP